MTLDLGRKTLSGSACYFIFAFYFYFLAVPGSIMHPVSLNQGLEPVPPAVKPGVLTAEHQEGAWPSQRALQSKLSLPKG